MAGQTQLTKTSEFTGSLKPGEVKPIFDEAMKSSVVQALARWVPVDANGVEIPVVVGKPEVKWVAEGERKPSTSASLGIKTMKPHKTACITMASTEVACANPRGYADIYKKQVVETMAVAFDRVALYGGGPFDTHIAQTQKSVVLGTPDKRMYGDLATELDLLLKARKKLNGFASDTVSETMFLNESDVNKCPIFVLGEVINTSAPVSVGRLLGRPAHLAGTVGNTTAKTIGFGGDWLKCARGVTSELSYRISIEATVTVNGELVSVFKRNLVVIVAEAEFAWLHADPESPVAFKTKG